MSTQQNHTTHAPRQQRRRRSFSTPPNGLMSRPAERLSCAHLFDSSHKLVATSMLLTCDIRGGSRSCALHKLRWKNMDTAGRLPTAPMELQAAASQAASAADDSNDNADPADEAVQTSGRSAIPKEEAAVVPDHTNNKAPPPQSENTTEGRDEPTNPEDDDDEETEVDDASSSPRAEARPPPASLPQPSPEAARKRPRPASSDLGGGGGHAVPDAFFPSRSSKGSNTNSPSGGGGLRRDDDDAPPPGSGSPPEGCPEPLLTLSTTPPTTALMSQQQHTFPTATTTTTSGLPASSQSQQQNPRGSNVLPPPERPQRDASGTPTPTSSKHIPGLTSYDALVASGLRPNRRTPPLLIRRNSSATSSTCEGGGEWGFYEDCDLLSRESASRLDATGLSEDFRVTPEYVLEDSLVAQALWHSTAGKRPPQPASERKKFEALWAKNFQDSMVDYDQSNFYGDPTSYISARGSPQGGGGGTPGSSSTGDHGGNNQGGFGFFSGSSDHPTNPNGSSSSGSFFATGTGAHQQNRRRPLPSAETPHVVPLLREQSPFGTSATKSWECPSCGELSSMMVHIPKYQVVKEGAFDIHAEYLVVVRLRFVTFGIWRRFKDFERLANTIIATNRSMDFENTLGSWRCVKRRQKWFRCLDKDYITLKCFLLERFLHDAVFESTSSEVFLDFLEIHLPDDDDDDSEDSFGGGRGNDRAKTKTTERKNHGLHHQDRPLGGGFGPSAAAAAAAAAAARPPPTHLSPVCPPAANPGGGSRPVV